MIYTSPFLKWLSSEFYSLTKLWGRIIHINIHLFFTINYENNKSMYLFIIHLNNCNKSIVLLFPYNQWTIRKRQYATKDGGRTCVQCDVRRIQRCDIIVFVTTKHRRLFLYFAVFHCVLFFSSFPRRRGYTHPCSCVVV